jgi:hypothetical protein
VTAAAADEPPRRDILADLYAASRLLDGVDAAPVRLEMEPRFAAAFAVWMRERSPESQPPPARDPLAGLLGVPVVPNPDLVPGGWQLVAGDGTVTKRGIMTARVGAMNIGSILDPETGVP